ncbi:MAG: ornithine cyclodeaminase [Rhizobiaceae bacterium]
MDSISFQDANHLLSWRGVADALEAGHRLKKAEIGDLILENSGNSLLNRGAWIEDLGMLLKSMSIFPQNIDLPSIQGAALLFDGKTGAVNSVIDGILVTKWKTAGDSVLGARLLAAPAPTNLLIVGAGTVAKSLFQAYHEVFPSLKKFTLWNRTAQRAESLARELATLGITVEVVRDLEAAAGDAQIISSATMSTEPVLKGDWISPGTHVDLIGAFKSDMREADDALLQKAELFVDSLETTIHHIGELMIPLKTGAIKSSDIKGDLYDLCNGNTARSSKDAITVFKNGGGAHLDLMTAVYIRESLARTS